MAPVHFLVLVHVLSLTVKTLPHLCQVPSPVLNGIMEGGEKVAHTATCNVRGLDEAYPSAEHGMSLAIMWLCSIAQHLASFPVALPSHRSGARSL